MQQYRSSILASDLRSEAGEWGTFVRKLALGVLPVVLAFSSLEGFAWRLGETVPLSRLASDQHGAPRMIWMGGEGRNFPLFKIRRAVIERPDVVVLGHSRAGEFRSAMFKPYSFYSLSLTAWTFDQYADILRTLLNEAVHPRVIIFNLDFFMFNARYDALWTDKLMAPQMSPLREHIEALVRSIRILKSQPTVYRKIWRRVSAVDGSDLRGASAIIQDGGFRLDGSINYGAELRAGAGKNNMEDDATLGAMPLLFADHMDGEAKKRFERFIQLCKDNGIAPIGIQMPALRKLMVRVESESRYGIYREFQSHETREWLNSLGVIFFDFLNMPKWTEQYRYFIDVVHSTELVNLAVIGKMARDEKFQRVLPRINPNNLDTLLGRHEAAGDSVDVFRFSF
jgi:hypothetical protein